MELTYPRFDRAEAEALAEFLASEDWHFHAGPRQTPTSAHARIVSGEFDGDPLFDLRLRSGHRGRGLGTAAVTWLTATVFGEFPDLNPIEATTRQEWPSESGARYDSIGYGILRIDWKMGVTTAVNWEDGP